MRDLTIHESVIRKFISNGAEWDEFYKTWTAYEGGYDGEQIHLTPDEAEVINAATTLRLCDTCRRVIEEGDRMLTTKRGRVYCEEHGLELYPPRPGHG